MGVAFPFLCLGFSSSKITPMLLGRREEHPFATSMKREESFAERGVCSTNASPRGTGTGKAAALWEGAGLGRGRSVPQEGTLLPQPQQR